LRTSRFRSPAGFLLGFAIPGLVEPLITADAYFGFVTAMFLVFGLVMQFPFVILLLSKVGIISGEQLRRNRRYVLIGIAIFAVIITPGGDPFSPTIMTLVMYPLYELTIRLVNRSNAPRSVSASATGARMTGESRTAGPSQPHVAIISGLSGAGKTAASKLLEDVGYRVIDTLPAELIAPPRPACGARDEPVRAGRARARRALR